MESRADLTIAIGADPLTRREQDILDYLGQNLSDREIADRLTLALSSVKWYTRQIYAKLAVENRRQAVEKAKELGLLARQEGLRPKHNLPRQLTRLIGREREIARVVELLGEYPLVTLTGSGGVGKTRLALAVAQEMLTQFEDGVWWVAIAPLADPFLVVRALADVLGVREVPDRTLLAGLVLYLQDRRTLLVLDNCEHMVETCARLAEDLLTGLPQLKILVSSREPLGVRGEGVFRVPSLTFPRVEQEPDLEGMAQFEAVRLFIDRARAALPEFECNPENAPAIAQICRRLDGIPLAIELAASRVSGLDPVQIASRLDQAFRLLSGGSRNAMERRRALRAAIDWSYNLLSQSERLLLNRLSVFVGGWTLQAAEAVCAGDEIAAEELLDLLLQLARKSMVLVEREPGGETRYRLLETIRQYAEEKMNDPQEVERLRRGYAAWFGRLAKTAEPHMYTGQRLVWTKMLVADLGNLRAVLEWAIDDRADVAAGLCILNALGAQFWFMTIFELEGVRWLEKGLAALSQQGAPDPLLRAESLLSFAMMMQWCSQNTDIIVLAELRSLCARLGGEGKRILAAALSVLCFNVAIFEGDLQKALAFIEEEAVLLDELGPAVKKWDLGNYCLARSYVKGCLHDLDEMAFYAEKGSALFHEVGDIWYSNDVLLGDAAYLRGDFVRAQQIFENAIAVQREIHEEIYDNLRKLGDALRGQRLFERALATYRESLALALDDRSRSYIVWLLCCFTFTEMEQAAYLPLGEAAPHWQRAARMLGANQAIISEFHKNILVEYQQQYEQAWSFLREVLGSGAFEATLAAGRAMDFKQIVAYLMEDEDRG